MRFLKGDKPIFIETFINSGARFNSRRFKIKITIDTKEDSHEEIKKVIRMLSSLVGEKEVFENKGNIFENNENPSDSSPGLFSMFADPAQEPKEASDAREEEKEDIPQVIEYD